LKFLVDECTGTKVAEWLTAQLHDVFSVYDEARGVSDYEILDLAVNENRILITIDKDFGEMVFREQREHHGVILLRLEDQRFQNKIEILTQLLDNYSDQLAENFVVVSERQVRIIRK